MQCDRVSPPKPVTPLPGAEWGWKSWMWAMSITWGDPNPTASPAVTHLAQPQCLGGHPLISSPHNLPSYRCQCPLGILCGMGTHFWGGRSINGLVLQVQHAGLHVAQGDTLRGHRHRLPGAVRGRGLGRPRGAPALHAYCLLRQEALPAQDGEQQTAQDQVSGTGTGLAPLKLSPSTHSHSGSGGPRSWR